MTAEPIEVTYKVITPLFCGGAAGDATEVRIPSIKGMLRWWWRALAWSHYEGSESDRLRAIHRDEAALFGSSDGGQSKVIMRLLPSASRTTIPQGDILTLDNKTVGEGARYLGYGVMAAFASAEKRTKAGQLTRPCLDAPFEIKLELRTRSLEHQQRTSLIDALKAMGLLGALGAKSRKGYGSLVLQVISQDGTATWTAPTSVDRLHAEIARLLTDAAANRAPSPASAAGRTDRDPASPLPPYTALSPRTRIVLLPGRDRQRPLELLDLVGCEMMRYRSWGHDGRVLGKESEKNFRGDHDLMKQRPAERSAHPERIVFGLPHNYGKRPPDKVGPGDEEDGDRRASPLLIHLHECGSMPVAVLAFLPARFLSRGDGAMINVGGPRVPITGDPDLWQPIHGFLARFFDPRRKDVFRGAREVRR